MSDEKHVIADLPKNQSETLRVQLVTFNRHHLCDVRAFVKYDITGEMGPSKKGVSLKVDQLDALIGALTEARAKAQGLGWLGDGDE